MTKYPLKIDFEEINFTREYKTFQCTQCGYKADVFGALQRSCTGAYNTHVCLNCRILIECEIEDANIDCGNNTIEFTPVNPICFVCEKDDVIPWDSELCKCPKCESKMEMIRLELNIHSGDTIKML